MKDTKENTMDQIKKIIHEEFTGVYDDQWIDAEDKAMERLQEEANLSSDEANEYIQKFYYGNL